MRREIWAAPILGACFSARSVESVISVAGMSGGFPPFPVAAASAVVLHDGPKWWPGRT